MFQKFLQSNDSRQDQSQFANDQGLERDQSEESDGERQESGGFQLEQQEKRQQIFLALLAFAS